MFPIYTEMIWNFSYKILCCTQRTILGIVNKSIVYKPPNSLKQQEPLHAA